MILIATIVIFTQFAIPVAAEEIKQRLCLESDEKGLSFQ